jgi:hypothetical protein
MKTSRIEKLTAEQESRLAEFRDKWMAIGLSTDPANREEAESAIRLSYRCARLPEPLKIVWCGSPLSQGLTRALILDKRFCASVRASVGASVWDSVWASVGASVGASVWASVGDSVWASVGASVWDSVGASVWDSVRASVRASVWDSVGDSVWDSVRASVGASVWASVGASGYGQHDAGGLAFYEYFREVVGLREQTGVLAGLFAQAKAAGWWLPHQNICWVSERHNLLARDERGRLHSVAGPAITYPDGWAIYAWHGVRVPSRVIEEQSKISVAEILSEPNTEVRRVMRNLYGNDRFMIDAGAQELDRSPQHGARLLALRLPGDPVDIRMMELTCPSTGSKYFERVPPDVRSAMEGLSWRFQVKPAEYRPQWET